MTKWEGKESLAVLDIGHETVNINTARKNAAKAFVCISVIKNVVTSDIL